MNRSITVLNTRPAHQAKSLNCLLQSLGISTVNCPALMIQPISPLRAFESMSEFEVAIFMSANAVRASCSYGSKDPELFNVQTILAIGPGTQAALEQYGFQHIMIPEQYCSEGLLALPALCEAAVASKKVIVFCGEAFRTLLVDELRKRHAQVSICVCYRRLCPPCPGQAQLQQLQRYGFQAIISTSLSGLHYFDRWISQGDTLRKTPLIVVSVAMEVAAQKRGWTQVVRASNASDQAIVEAVMECVRCS